MSRSRWILLVLAALLAPPFASAQVLEPKIVNGLPTQAHPTTGALLSGGDPNAARSLCTGTLIGCSTFLTAAHCVCAAPGELCQPPNAPDPSAFQVYLQHAGFLPVQSVTVRTDFAYPVGDVAILKLGSPVSGIAPVRINKTEAPAFGTPGTIVGFGRSGGTNFDYGIKRSGAVTTGPCPLFVSPTTSVCWTFDAPAGPPGTDSNTCSADSGGPLLIDFGAGPVVAGVTSGGTNATCLATDESYDANVYTYRNWLQSTGGADINATNCGALPQVGDDGATIATASGSVSSSAPEGRSAFDVAAGSQLLRVAMNAHDDGIANFNLYVKQDEPPTTTSYDCARTGTGQFAACEFGAPAAGTWHVLVRRVTGSGAYQVTATSFAPGTLSIELAAGAPTVSPGSVVPLTITLANQTASQQSFAWLVSLVRPGGTQTPLIPVTGLLLPSGGGFAPQVQLPLPAGAPLGTWGVGALLWQPGIGVVDQAFVTFQVE